MGAAVALLAAAGAGQPTPDLSPWLGASGSGVLRVPQASQLRRPAAEAGERCAAVCLVGLPRALVRKRVVRGYARHVVAPLQPCVDTYFMLGLQAQVSSHYGKGEASEGSVEHWGQLSEALTQLRPVVARHVGPPKGVPSHLWSFAAAASAKHDACIQEVQQEEKQAGRQYRLVIRVRPDLLFLRPLPVHVFEAQPPLKTRYMDFFYSSWTSASVRAAERGIALRARICRPVASFQRRLDANDQLWQNLLPLHTNPPGWVNMMAPLFVRPRYGLLRYRTDFADLMYRAGSIYCFRQQAETAGMSFAPCPAGGEHDMLRELLRALLAERQADVDRVVISVFHDGERSARRWEVENPELRRLYCACSGFRQATGQLPTDPDLGKSYDHSSLDCSDAVAPADAEAQRARWQVAAAARLSAALTAAKGANTVYAELAIFCDIYRYQLDFIAEEAAAGLAEQRRLLRERLPLLLQQHAASGGVPPATALQRLSARLAAAPPPPDAVGQFEELCAEMTVTDWFRTAADHAAVSRRAIDWGSP
eukprot:TRINITY_DN31702_c0_g1_i1.p1 TRINITY_DN31702_c0_g1~~TRINITY_DN31702_c0_g1_i1.p1  ORF type:complete len:536 (+),score=194.25 TRINITY_DN31702_c0_g1_i1:83-1690(+)